MKIVVRSYWDFVGDETIRQLYPEGFPGWDLEHGGVLETSLMLALYPDLVHLDRAVDVAPASFPPSDVYPARPDWTPASGTLSSPRASSAEKGQFLLDVCTKGIVGALRAEFGRAPRGRLWGRGTRARALRKAPPRGQGGLRFPGCARGLCPPFCGHPPGYVSQEETTS